MLQQVVPDDTFVISLSTALGMGEYLVALLNTVIQNLPELELRMMRNTLEQSVALADDLLFNISISSPFDTLTINDGAHILLSACGCFLILTSLHRPWHRWLQQHYYDSPHPWQGPL